jgi:hypothetical protein
MSYVHRDHSKHVEHMRRMLGELWDFRWSEGGKTGGKTPEVEKRLDRDLSLQVEPVVAQAIVFDQDAISGMPGEQLPDALVGSGHTLDFGLM